MAIKYGFFDSIAGDRKYNAEDISSYLMGIVSSGVYADKSTSLQVLANDGMTVEVQPGRAMLHYHYLENDSPLTLTLDKGGTQDRVDAIVARMDRGNRLCEIVIKKGTEAAKPSAPVMERTDVIKEYMLASVYITKLSTSITQSSITDTRADKTVCGWVTGVIDQVDTSTLFIQWQAAYQEAYAEMGDYSKAQKAAWEALFQETYTDLGDYTQEQKAAWEAFFQNVQNDTVFPVPNIDDSGKTIVVNESGDAFTFGKAQAESPITSAIPLDAEAWIDPDEEAAVIDCAAIGAVPVSRTINGTTLDKDIEIDLESTDWIEVPLSKTYATQGSVMNKKYGKIVFFGFVFIPNTTKITDTWTSYTLATGLPVPASTGASQTCSAHETGTRLFCNCYVEDGDLMFMTYEQLVTWGDVRGFGVYEAED